MVSVLSVGSRLRGHQKQKKLWMLKGKEEDSTGEAVGR